jgi:hypothetical protein
MPFITTIGTTSLFGFGTSNIAKYIGTLWSYNSSGESDWVTLGDWYRNSSHTVLSSSFPTTANPVVLLNNANADVTTWSAPASIDLNGYDLDITGHPYVSSASPPGYTCDPPYVFETELVGSVGGGDVVAISGHIVIPG